MTYETLQYYDANGASQEVAIENLSANGSAVKVQMELRSHSWSDFHIVLPQPPEAVVAIPFLSHCIVWACRSSGSGAANSFSGGQMIFQGRRWDNPGSASAEARRLTNEILLCDALRDLAQITYQIDWQAMTGGTTTNPTFTSVDFPDVVLFQNSLLGQMQPNGTFAPYNPGAIVDTITTWQQIMAIVYYATNYLSGPVSAGATGKVQLQMGTVPEFTPSYCNFYSLRSAKCLDAITICLRPHPLVYTEVDYTTSPATLHFRYAGNLMAVTLPYKGTDGAGNVHVASDIRPLPELVPASVKLFYQITSQLNGKAVVGYTQDIYPPGATANLLEEVYSVNIQGPAASDVTKTFTSYAFVPTNLTLWRNKVPSLKEQLDGGQIPNDGQAGALAFVSTGAYDAVTNPKGIQVIDHNGVPIDYADTFIFWSKQAIYDWFVSGGEAAAAVTATVKAFFSYQRDTKVGAGASAANLTPKALEHEHSMRVTLTNMPSGNYTLSQQLTTGEGIPTNLAQNIWTELQWLQYKLQHVNWQVGRDAATAPAILKPGKHAINLSGGLAAWQTMKAIPESVQIEFFRVTLNGVSLLGARHTIRCGPVNHLNPQYRVQLMNLFANRQIQATINANQRLSGESGAGTDLSAEDPTDSAVPSPEIPQVLNIAAVDGGSGTVSNITLDAAQIFAAAQLNNAGV